MARLLLLLFINEGKECRVRQQFRIEIENLSISGERMEVDGPRSAADLLAAKAVAMARVATALHLASAAQLRPSSCEGATRKGVMR